MKNNIKNRRPVLSLSNGFTLVELIIYIALFSIIIGGGMVATYSIIQSMDSGSNHILVEEEANFLLNKINWALTGATSAKILSTTRLETTKNISGVVTVLSFNMCTADLTIEKGSGKTCANAPIKLNSSNVVVSGLSFVSVGTNGIKTTFTLTSKQNGKNVTETFTSTKYLRI